jgi:hypothetical protein
MSMNMNMDMGKDPDSDINKDIDMDTDIGWMQVMSFIEYSTVDKGSMHTVEHCSDIFPERNKNRYTHVNISQNVRVSVQ